MKKKKNIFRIKEFIVITSIFVGMGLFTLANGVYSQWIAPLYFQMVNGNKSAVVTWLKYMEQDPHFNELLTAQKAEYGNYIEWEVSKTQGERTQRIDQLEKALQLNPKSRDILVALARLYKLSNQQEKSDSYLQQAQAVDPTVERD
ncbi:hypothetical protein HGB07_00550 [Candidatus Roizmanbacteria bacterium]|nr:hypothetical protein [Candidatus Roizmanbacteria bacterium]